ncbi:hypothetical protein [Sphingomonas quercus]|uniref:DUF2306 domain-containing protein n=1 Tax=Sphingomonas quercus TaxID=2842451 RepID=A0ABS6BEY4_9SPHN|nr:hypothetical protein [Sphingomonas quercus]MBU3076729.1 hypothetical protein [Sphingomonas quercus]
MATLAAAQARGRAFEHIFFSGAAVAMIMLIVAGFLPSYYLRGVMPAAVPMLPMTPLVHLHGLVFSLWLLLYLAQTLLAGSGRIDLHRRLGLAGLPLVVAMAAIALTTAVNGVGRHSAPPGIPPLNWLVVPLFDVPVFAGLIGAALWQRRRPIAHKRLMYAAMTGMLGPGLGRLPAQFGIEAGPAFFFGLPDLFMVALMLWDRKSSGRIQPVTLWATGLIVASQLIRMMLIGSAEWYYFAGAVFRLAGWAI